MKNIKLWPHITVIGLVVAIAAGLGVAWWMKNEPSAQAEEVPYAARIQRIDGQVAFNDSLGGAAADSDWSTASVNQPFSVGDRIYTRENSRASVAFTGRNFAVLDPNTSVDLVSFDDERTQVALRDGSAMFDVGYLRPNELFEVATPYGAVDLVEPGLYNVGFDNDGNVLVSVLSGLAQVVGLAGSGQISKGEMLTLVGQTAAQVALSRLNGDDAGYLVDDYYRYQYGDAYDGRYSSYDAYVNDPYYYDPYRRNASYQYTSAVIPGLNDLDYYGDWQNVDGYGYAWRPRVDTGWAPYQQGQWMNDYPYGPTWVSAEPWGYAPYHYGRWANVGNQWYWVPEPVNSTPLYAPALVAFVPLDQNQIGWVPLAPGEAYVPRYYDENWQPHYLTRANLVPAQLVNLAIPGAVTVVPVDAWGRPIDRGMVRRLDPNVFARVNPTLEPLTLTPLRNAVVNSAWGRGKIDLPPGIAKKLNDTPVFFANAPRTPRFRKDTAKALRWESVPDQAKREKIKFEDRRGEGFANSQQAAKPEDVARKQEIHRLNQEAAKGNREAAKQSQQLQQQQRRAEFEQRKTQAQQERAARRAAQSPAGERVGNPATPPATSRGRQDVPKAREPQRNMEQPRRREPQARQDVPQAHQGGQHQPAKVERQKESPATAGGGKGKGKKP